jgi:hypothetical protein
VWKLNDEPISTDQRSNFPNNSKPRYLNKELTGLVKGGRKRTFGNIINAATTLSGSLPASSDPKSYLNKELTRLLPKSPNPESQPRRSHGWRNPATNAVRDRHRREDTISQIGQIEGDKLKFIFLDSKGNPDEVYITVTDQNRNSYQVIFDHANLRELIRAMWVLNNESPAKPGEDFIELWADNLPPKGLQSLVDDLSKPIIIR